MSWRVFAALTTFALVYAFTGTLLLLAGIGLVDLITKLVFYYVHERAAGVTSAADTPGNIEWYNRPTATDQRCV